MNRWEGTALIVGILIVGFIVEGFLQPGFLQLFATYILGIVVAIFGVTALVVIFNIGSAGERRRR